MDRKQIIEDFFNYIKESLSLRISPNGVMSINEEKVKPLTLINIINMIPDSELRQRVASLNAGISADSLYGEIKKQFLILNKKHNASFSSADIVGIDFSTSIPIVSIKNADEKIFWDTESRKFFKYDYRTYTETVKDRVAPIPAYILFNPYRPEIKYVDYGENGKLATHFNLYQRPSWQYERELDPAEAKNYTKPPFMIAKFMAHLFPNYESREFVYDWLHHAITSRCETYLVLNGSKGIGKGIFAENICKNLIGSNNFKIAQPSALENGFNSILSECRMILFDEMRMNEQDKIDKLKRYINEVQGIERKGFDAVNERIYNSYIISSNNITDIKIEWDDRRFSIVDLCTENLKVTWSEDEIKNFIDELNYPESDTLREFGYFLMYRFPKFDRFTPFKGEHFYKVCYSSLPEWSKFLVSKITAGVPETKIDLEEFALEFKTTNRGKWFPLTDKIKQFFENYKHYGEDYLGVLVFEEDKHKIIVNEKYRLGMDTTGLNFKSLEMDLI